MIRRPPLRRAAFALALPAVLGAVRAGAAIGTTETMSVTPAGNVGSAASDVPHVSATGRFVVFDSYAVDLMDGGNSNVGHVFLRDRDADTTEIVTLNSAGQPANGVSFTPYVTPDGRFVVFHSHATNLDGADANGETRDVYLRDRVLATTERISVSTAGVQGDRESAFGTVSDDGRFVAFSSSARNLVGDDLNGMNDIFVRDRTTGTTERVSIGLAGDPDGFSSGIPVISGDGRFVAFASQAKNLVRKDTNNTSDVFVFDRATRTTERVSVTRTGKQTNNSSQGPWISANGRFVAFESFATNLGVKMAEGHRGIHIHDRILHRTDPVSTPPRGSKLDRSSFTPSVSDDGRVVAFVSQASVLVAGDTNDEMDAFVVDRMTGVTERVSRTSAGGQIVDPVTAGRVSRDGRTVVYGTADPSIAPNDANGATDVFAVGLDLPPGNQPPVARAGDDRSIVSPTKKTKVQLDGTASTDPEGTKLKFKWLLAGKSLSTSSRPKLSLVAGVHTLTLVVTDKKGLLGIDDVVITILAE